MKLFAEFAHNKALKLLLATNSLILLAGAMLGPIYAIFVEQIGGNILDASIAGAIFALTAGIVTLLSGQVADKIKESKIVVAAGYALMAVGFFLYTQVDSIAFLFVVQVILGLGEAIYSPAFDEEYSNHLDKGKAATERGAWEAMNYFSAAVGAAIGGFIVSRFGFNAIFVIMGSLCLLSALYIYVLPKKVL